MSLQRNDDLIGRYAFTFSRRVDDMRVVNSTISGPSFKENAEPPFPRSWIRIAEDFTQRPREFAVAELRSDRPCVEVS